MIAIAEGTVAGMEIEAPVTADPEEVLLVRLCAEGDPRGFEMLYDRWGAPMRNFAAHMLRSESDAEDAVQETFLKVARSVRRFDFRSQFSTWLFRILVNTCRDLIRKRRRRIEEESLDSMELRFQSDSSEPSIRMTLSTLVANLPEKERTVFVLYEIEGFSHSEIAEVLGKSESYSKWLLFTTKKRLREELRRVGELT